MTTHILLKLFAGFTLISAILTVLAILIVGFMYKNFIKPFFQVRAYKNIPGVLIRYNIGLKKVWERKNSLGEPIEFSESVPFYNTKINTLLFKYPKLKAIVSNLMKNPHITIIDHLLAAEVIKNPDNYEHLMRRSLLGKSSGRHVMIHADPPEWKRQREIISRAFDIDSMRKIMPLIQKIAKAFFENETFTNGKELQVLHSTFVSYAWEALSWSFFGDDLTSYTPYGQPFSKILNPIVKQQFRVFMSPQYQIFGESAALWSPKIRKARKNVLEIRKLAEKLVEKITEKIKQGEIKNTGGRKGILELILDNSHGDESLTSRDLIGNFITFSMIGTDPSANTSSNLLYCLATNLEVKKKVIEDIQSHWDGQEEITPEILNKMEYLHAALLETLRVMSPMPLIIPRIAKCNHMVGDIPIKKGYIVQVAFSPTWFSPQWIKNPEVFRPERWIRGHEAYEQLADKFIFNPFSFGPRICIAQDFAMMQMKIAMCYFLPRFEFNLPKDFKLSPMVMRGTMEPREPLKMFIKPKELIGN